MLSNGMNALALGLVSTLAVPANAYWRMSCPGTLVTARMDPIVDAGKVSGHAHIVFGSDAFSVNMDYADTQKATCTTCGIEKDNSNYWVPQLYFQDKSNGSFTSVSPVGGAGGTVYYQQRATYPGKTLKAFPAGLRMTAGNPELRTYNDTQAQQAVNHACINYAGGAPPQAPTFPTVNCPNGIRTQVYFPSCWDGVNLDSENHQSHMAYPSGVDTGVCPDSHPNPVISIFYEVLWDTGPFASLWDGDEQPFVLSMGDSTGLGYHGDFVMGWDVDLLQSAVDDCTSDSGAVSDCSHFTQVPTDQSNSCAVPSPVDEQVLGNLKTLPGCNPVTNTPTVITDCGATTTLSGTVTEPFTDLTSSKKWEYVGCGADDYYSRALTGQSENVNTMTVEDCVDFCISNGNSVAGMEYGNQCYCANSIPASAQPTPGSIGTCNMPCAGNGKETCGGSLVLSLYQKCGSTCTNAQYDSVDGDAPTVSESSAAASSASTPTTMASVVSMASSSATASTTSATSTTTTAGSVNQVASPVAPIATATASAASTSAGSSGEASNVTLPSGWVAAGCFSDSSTRAIANVGWWGVPITSSGCAKFCDSTGYSYAGTENSGQCFCGNALTGSTKLDDSKCDMACAGGDGEICGGGWALSVFKKSSSARRRSHLHRRGIHQFVADS